jgi:integrase
MKKPKNSIKIIVRGQTLSLVLPPVYCGKRHVLALGLPNTADGWKFAEHKAQKIEIDLMGGHFDRSLAAYKCKTTETEIDVQQILTTFAENYQTYIESKKRDVSPGTWKATYLNTLNHLNECPYKLSSEVWAFKDWMIQNRTPDTARRVLMQINAAYNWALERGLVKNNPFAGKIKVKRKKSKPKINPFSNSEKIIIINAFGESNQFNYLKPLIQFFFLSGCRTSEAIALQWKHIKTDCSAISFEEVIVLGQGGAQRKKGTKQSPQRNFPCNRQLQKLLLSVKPEKAIANASVFLGPDGSCVTHQNLRTAWYGKGNRLGIVRQLAADGAIESYRPQYNTRHTMISNCLEAGISPMQIAAWVGNSAEIIFRNYAGIISKVSVPEF